MDHFLPYLLVLAAYLVGSFPTGVVLSRFKYGLDVREMGSGNIGATNVTRVFGWYAGVLVFAIDFLKAYVPLRYLLTRETPDSWLVFGVGLALVVGHCFSIYLKFHGGKGVATSLGCLFALSPWIAVITAAVYLLLLTVTRISAVGSLGGVLASLVSVWFFPLPPPEKYLVWVMSLVILIRHHSNIRRLVSDLKKGKKK